MSDEQAGSDAYAIVLAVQADANRSPKHGQISHA
jgi:hypothetical protein